MAEIAPRISVDPQVSFGKPVIAGTRVPVETLLRELSHGMTAESVAEAYAVTREDVLAAISFAADQIGEDRYLAVGAK